MNQLGAEDSENLIASLSCTPTCHKWACQWVPSVVKGSSDWHHNSSKSISPLLLSLTRTTTPSILLSSCAQALTCESGQVARVWYRESERESVWRLICPRARSGEGLYLRASAHLCTFGYLRTDNCCAVATSKKKRVSTAEKSEFRIAQRFSVRKYPKIAQT